MTMVIQVMIGNTDMFSEKRFAEIAVKQWDCQNEVEVSRDSQDSSIMSITLHGSDATKICDAVKIGLVFNELNVKCREICIL